MDKEINKVEIVLADTQVTSNFQYIFNFNGMSKFVKHKNVVLYTADLSVLNTLDFKEISSIKISPNGYVCKN
jgi:hypothetical protein